MFYRQSSALAVVAVPHKLLPCLALIASIAAAPGHWEPVQNAEKISVDRIVTPDSPVVMFRGRAVVEAPVSVLMAVILDHRTQSEWNNTGYDLKILQKISDTELFFYSALRAPWPVKDREFVIKLNTIFARPARQIEIQGSEVSHMAAPLRSDRIRLPICRITWALTALTGNKTYVTVTFRIDPGGWLPRWIMNRVTAGMPFRALRNIRHLIAANGFDPVFRRKFLQYDKWHP